MNIFKKLALKIATRKIKKTLKLEDGPMEPGKKWYRSVTIWAGIWVIVRGAYQGAVATFGAPPIPPIVDSIITTILGEEVIRGRMNATQAIGTPNEAQTPPQA